MTEETYAVRLPAAGRDERLRAAGPLLREMGRFVGVGAVGYAVNLAIYAAGVHVARFDYRAAAVVAFVFALATTFVLNRHFTFAAGDGSLARQAWRYLLVNGAGFAANLLVLQICVEWFATGKVPAEALAAAAAAPVNYAGGRLWAFARSAPVPA